MKTKKRTSEALMSVCTILMLAGSLLAVDVWAQTADPEDSAEVDVSAQQEVPDLGAPLEAPDLSETGSQGASREVRQQWRAAREARRKEQVELVRLAKESAAQSKADPPPVSRPATLTGMAEVGGRQAGLDSKPSPVVVSRLPPMSRPASITGIQVSFKLDPRLTKSLYMYMGEGWVSPPISIYAGVRDGTTPTVDARADILDAKGQPVDISPEWIPADPEMVTVSPGQGNEVQITVQHAGQSNLQVTSQRVSRQLSIMAWYQDDGLQVEISQKP